MSQRRVRAATRAAENMARSRPDGIGKDGRASAYTSRSRPRQEHSYRKIRNSKSEIRKKFQIRIRKLKTRRARGFDIGDFDFGFLSDFGFRVSDFPSQVSAGTRKFRSCLCPCV